MYYSVYGENFYMYATCFLDIFLSLLLVFVASRRYRPTTTIIIITREVRQPLFSIFETKRTEWHIQYPIPPPRIFRFGRICKNARRRIRIIVGFVVWYPFFVYTKKNPAQMVLFIYICCHSFSFLTFSLTQKHTHTKTFANLLTSTLTEYSQSLFFFRRAINKYVYCVHNKETHTHT